MPLSTAQSLGWSLCHTLKTIVLLVKTSDGFSVMPIDDYDGDPDRIVREYDPFAR